MTFDFRTRKRIGSGLESIDAPGKRQEEPSPAATASSPPASGRVSRWLPWIVFGLVLAGQQVTPAEGPLPTFDFQGIALHPKDLVYSPNDDLIHPTIVKTEGRVKNPLGRYYLYYAPHKHIATSMAYSDSLDGPWIEYKENPVVKGPSAPEVRWIEESQKFFLWGHRKNSQTELWTSDDGIHFEYDSVSIKAANIGTRNATYNRVYEYPLERFGSKYITLYSGFIEDRGIRCIWLAHSKDAKNWTQVKTPLVEPVDGEMNDCYGPALLRWQGRNFITYQDHTTWRGGNLKYVELDRELNPVGAGGERFVLVDPPAEPPLNDRLRGAEFYREGDTLYLYSSGSMNPRLIVYAKAEVGEHDPKTLGYRFPSVDQLPALERLPDPFRFFQSDRRVADLQDWKERQDEIRRLDKLGLYDHSPPGHGICEDDMHTIMDFADKIFYGKEPKSGKAFNQIGNPEIVGFDWKMPSAAMKTHQ